jgi:hypothetical protein
VDVSTSERNLLEQDTGANQQHVFIRIFGDVSLKTLCFMSIATKGFYFSTALLLKAFILMEFQFL